MYLGLDLGTSALKALLIDDDQSIVATASAPLSVSRPQSGWSEQDPADWIQACEQVFDQLKSTHSKLLSAVSGIGISGQMHGATLLDARDDVLSPCILWNDTRSYAEARELDGNSRFREISGNIVFPGFTAPKLVWMRNNKPELFKQTAMVLLPKDYLRLWLTGEHVSDMSDAAGTSWLDVGARDWSDALLDATMLNRSHMPQLVEGSAASGMLKPSLASRWGISNPVVVAGGAGDNAAAACGLGTVAPGSAFVSLGTSGVLFASNAAYLPNAESAVHTFCHALPNTWHQMGVILSATDALNWYSGVCGQQPQELTDNLGEELKAPQDVVFLPYLSGERTPHNDASIRGAFIGLDHAHDQSALTQAVLEGVSYALRDSLEALQSAGTQLQRVMAVGGGSRSTYWLKALAAILNLPVDMPADGDFGGAFGAARLGLIAAQGLEPAGVCKPPDVAQTFEPNQKLRPLFEQSYQRYKTLYPALSGVTP